jgi:S-disulfanyl-L-cysteine oxidoreductase SoxD
MSALLAATAASCSDRPAEKTPARPAPPQPLPAPVTPPPVVPPIKAEVAPKAVLNGPLRPPFTQTTLSGIYTTDEAKEGNVLYLGFCASCHQAISHTGPAFRQKWAGRPLSDLYDFMRVNMPKNDPGTLSEYQYGVLLAYMLQMNKMPAGKAPIMGEKVDLTTIRIDTVRNPGRPAAK